MARRKMTTERKRALVSTAVISLAAAFVVVAVALLFGNRPERTEPVAAEVDVEQSWPVQTTPPPEDAVPGAGEFLDPEAVDRSDPDAVARAAATLAASHDTVTDDTVTDATRRAGPLMDDSVVDALQDPERSSVGPVWLEAQQHEAFSVPVVMSSPIPPSLDHAHEGEEPEAYKVDGEVAVPYEFQIEYSWQGRDGWVSEPQDTQVRLVALSLTERDGEWVVVEFYYGDPLTSVYDAG